jgi:tetraacyldisaccharide 4'-kinase
MSAESWLNKIWYGGARPPWWLLPLSAIYAGAAFTRRWMYSSRLRRSVSLPCPVIVVGNLSVGGTGKTPLVIWLVAQLTELGFRPGVVTRGYGGSAGGVSLVQAGDDPKIAGDEAVLLARRTHAPIAIGRDRPRAAGLLINAGCNVIVSDDGLQHYALKRDCEIIVVDGVRGFGNARLLPAGPLRESQSRLRVVDAVVFNGGAVDTLVAGAARMRLEASRAIAMRYNTAKPLAEFAGQSVHAIAAIGNPQRFFELLQTFGIKVIAHPLPDHAPLRIDDISFADDLAVFMTEKDAVKCAEIAGPHHWYVPISVVFEPGDAAALRNTVVQAIKQPATGAKG